jgi:hypothetical protein
MHTVALGFLLPFVFLAACTTKHTIINTREITQSFVGSDPNESSINTCVTTHRIDNYNYLIITEQMYAYQFGFRLFLVTFDADANDQKIIPLKIPEFDLSTETIAFKDYDCGYLNYKSKSLKCYTKGAGYGGYSTKRKFCFSGNALVLLKQKGTKDIQSKDYKLKGDKSDWYLQYSRKGLLPNK